MARVFGLVLVLLLAGCDNRGPMQALGTLERDRVALTATTSEVVVDLPVRPGSPVTTGTVVVKLDDTLQLAEVEHARAEVARATANLEKLRHGAREEEVAAARAKVSGAEAAVTESRANFRRLSDLKRQHLVSQADLDQARARYDADQAALKSARESLLLLTHGTREEDLQAGEAELKAAQATLQAQQKRLADLTVRATRDGVLDNLPWNLGERVTQGSPVAIILAGHAPFARVYVPEPYRARLHVGDVLSVSVDGVDTPIEGHLRWISSEPAFTPYYALNAKERARLMFLAEVQLPDSAARLPSGVPAQVTLP